MSDPHARIYLDKEKGPTMTKFAYIDYSAAAQEREDWLAWLQAKAAERRLSDPSDKV